MTLTQVMRPKNLGFEFFGCKPTLKPNLWYISYTDHEDLGFGVFYVVDQHSRITSLFDYNISSFFFFVLFRKPPGNVTFGRKIKIPENRIKYNGSFTSSKSQGHYRI